MNAPPGSLIRGKIRDRINGHTFSIYQRTSNSSLGATHFGHALVLGAPAPGSCLRYVMLIPPWENREGRRIVFAECNADDLEVIQ